jgi:hypothetical protein
MKTIHKFILVFAIMILSITAFNSGYAHKTIAEKALSTKDIQNLAPVTPVEAEFIDDNAKLTYEIISLAPSTPAVANFDDYIDTVIIDIKSLAPLTPVEADFE